MTTKIARQPAALDVARLADVDTATLRGALADSLRLTAGHLCYLAAIWAELERRGEDLSPLKKGIGAYLPGIAAGTVLAEAVVAFAGEPATLRRVAALPVEQQRRAVESGDVPKPKRVSRVAGRNGPAIPGYTPAASRPAARPAEPTAEPTDEQIGAARPSSPLEMLAAMIRHASPGDAAEMVADAVRASGEPAAVARRLIPILERIAAGRSAT